MELSLIHILITALELAFGVVLNRILGLNIWDYSDLPLNFLGQICLPFTAAWFLLAAVAILLDDYLRHWLWHEEMPVSYTHLDVYKRQGWA